MIIAFVFDTRFPGMWGVKVANGLEISLDWFDIREKAEAYYSEKLKLAGGGGLSHVRRGVTALPRGFGQVLPHPRERQ